MSFVYPMFSDFDYNDVSKVNDFSARLNPPSAKAFFGTDNNGKSLFDGVWFGARNSIIISFIATVINVVSRSYRWWNLGDLKIHRPYHDGSL